jgi:hypothetical protein
VPVSGIHDFRRFEAGFPIRIASGMTVSGTGGRLTLISFLLHEFSDKANFGSPYTFDPANNISLSHHPASPPASVKQNYQLPLTEKGSPMLT